MLLFFSFFIDGVFRIPLNSDDDTFRDLRDLPISHVGKALKAKALECAEFIRKKDELHSIIEIKNYVKKLPSVQAMQKGLTNQ